MSRLLHNSKRPPAAAQAALNSDALNRAVWGARLLFIVCLLFAAAILGYIAHHYLRTAERRLAETQFESIADRSLKEARRIAEEKRWSCITLASMVSEMFPNATAWPFVAVTGFETIVANLLSTSTNYNMGFAPMVLPEQLAEWEDFFYDYYENKRNPPFPKGTIGNPFGKGAWRTDDPLARPETRYHDDGLTTSYGSPNQVLFPVAHVGRGLHGALLASIHADRDRGPAIDLMMDCSAERADSWDAEAISNACSTCGVITDMIHYQFTPIPRGPAAAILQPIYAANEPTKLVGVTATSIFWDQIFENVFSKKASGLDCVLETDKAQVYMYTVTDGIARLVGEGDFHQTKYDRFRRHIHLTGQGTYHVNSPTYTLSIYPNDQLYEVYSTNNPWVATVGAVCIIAFTSLLFLLYDFMVRREFVAKQELLASKRKFMRFVSHEVRTPMNSVCMGISVIQHDIASLLGYDSANTLSKIEIESPINSANEENKAGRAEHEWFKLTEEVLRHTQSAVDVLDDLLNYDKIESGTFALELTVIPICEHIETVVNEFKLQAATAKLDFQLNFTDLTDAKSQGGPASSNSTFSAKTLSKDMLDRKIVGDAFRLTQVLRNVVSNALKCTPEKGTLSVHATCVPPVNEGATLIRAGKAKDFRLKSGESVCLQQSGYLKFTVTDGGAGMTKAQLSKCFREGIHFNMTELQASTGIGFGLCVSKGIVELHDGALEADSDGSGCGTTVALTLPLYFGPSSEAKSEVKKDLSSSIRSTQLNLLVVDDSVSNRKLLCRLLTQAGHICDLAENGKEAVEMVVKKMQNGAQYDSVLLDFKMPVMNGPEAAKEMRRAGSKVHIVGITGNMLPEDISHFLSCGANDVLPKPLKMPHLLDLWRENGVLGRTAIALSSPER